MQIIRANLTIVAITHENIKERNMNILFVSRIIACVTFFCTVTEQAGRIETVVPDSS
jgi:hypothetical protein